MNIINFKFNRLTSSKGQLSPLKLLSKVALMGGLYLCSSSLLAATYYVSASGSNSNSGTSVSSPWKSLSSMMWRIKSGDTILLKRGEVFYETSSIMITTSNTTLGAYGSGDRPIIDGNGFKEPGGVYDAMVSIGSTDGSKGHNSVVKDIELRRGSGMGLSVVADNAVVRNVFVNESMTSGITIYPVATGALIEDSEVFNHNVAWGPDNGYQDRGLGKGNWGIGIAAKGGNFIIRNNFVHHGWGEGIGVNCGGYDGVVEGNRLESNKIGIYIDVAQNIQVRDNQVKGANQKAYWRSDSTIGQGIGVNHENWCASQAVKAGRPALNSDLVFEGNSVTGTSAGFFVWSQVSESVFSNIRLTCNSFVDNLHSFDGGDVSVKQMLVKNNLFAAVDSGDSQPMMYFSINGGFDFKENTWIPEPSIDVVKSVLDSYTSKLLNYVACSSGEISATSPPMPPSEIAIESYSIQ